MDLIQARYGWTDDVVYNLPYSRFCQLQDFLIDKKEQEVREQYIYHSFNAWLNGAGGKKTFTQFIKHLGLDKKKDGKQTEMSKEDAERIIQRNIENAKNIIQLDQKMRKQKEG